MYVCSIHKLVFDITKEQREILWFEEEHPDWIKKEMGSKWVLFEHKDDYYLDKNNE